MIQIEKFQFKQLMAMFIISFIVGYVLVYLIQQSNTLTNQFPLGVDIYPRWVGGRAFWQGESPYSSEVDLQTQIYVFNRPALPEEDTFSFYYPPYIAIVFAPLILLPAYTAALFWTASTWAILSVLAFLIVKSVPGRVSPWVLFFVFMSIFFQRSALLVLLNGQYVYFILACWGLAYFMIRHDHDFLGGTLLALSIIKPSLALLPIVVFLFWLFKIGKYRVILSFFLTLLLFLGITFIQLGWWLPEFFIQLGKYDDFPRQWIPADILSIPGLFWLGGTIILIYLGIRAAIRTPDEFPWILFWGSISLILLVTPHTAEYDIPVLLLPFFIYAPRFLQTRAGTLTWALLLWTPWLTWGILMLIGYTTSYWYSIFWFHYPQILVIALITFLSVVEKENGTPIMG